jgi:hypothetical protein
MSTSSTENIVFMIVRGIVALSIVGVAIICVVQGVQFFKLPHLEAEAIQLNVLGLRLSASGLGAVIFGTGIAMCFVALRTAPRRFETKTTVNGARETSVTAIEKPASTASPDSGLSSNELTVVTELPIRQIWTRETRVAQLPSEREPGPPFGGGFA